MLIDHVNLRCHDPEAMAAFLEMLGCVARGERPDASSHGYWMYDDSGRAVIHLSARSGPAGVDGLVDHVAFRVEDVAALRTRLSDLGLGFTERENTAAGVVQFKVDGPEGLVLEFQSPTRRGARDDRTSSR